MGLFQSTPLTRGETRGLAREFCAEPNFNPLPSHEGRRQISVGFNDCFFISIHSPHTRGDPLIDKIAALEAISIRSPHARGDRSRISRSLEQTISIHSPHTRGDVQDALSSAGNGGISIRSPHTRGDDLAVRDLQSGFDFNPLPSHEGRQVSSGQACTCSISIHSPHTRGDSAFRQTRNTRHSFQSTPLMRGETRRQVEIWSSVAFQSTPLMRGETAANGWAHLRIVISIRSPLTRGDALRHGRDANRRGISIRSPLTRGDPFCFILALTFCISIRSPLTRGDRSARYGSLWPRISIHSPHTRGDPGCCDA